MAFVWVAIFLLFKTFYFACCEVQIGTTTPDKRMNGSIIIVVRTDLEKCGRVCLYQDQCVAINHNSNTSICELLKSKESLEESPGFNYSNINTWNMTNDPCYPNLCSDMQSCRKACHGPGSGGYYCTTFETPCDQSECQNNATCINGLNSYTCRCPEGYSGDRCQKTPCDNVECKNNGTCIHAPSSYTCHCTVGYIGEFCEETPCDQSNCQNNATCTNDLNTYKCLCPEGKFGRYCQADPCYLQSYEMCSNGGFCIDEPQPSISFPYTCLCPEGYSGRTCQVCGELYGNNGTITSTNYPDIYPQHGVCSWTITTEEGSSILLKFQSFAAMMPETEKCTIDDDRIEVFNGTVFDEDKMLLRHCNHSIPDEILLTENRMLILFWSLSANNTDSNGFKATYETVYGP